MKIITNAMIIICTTVFGLSGMSQEKGIETKINPDAAQVSCSITVKAEKKQQMTYGMDFERLWAWDDLEPDEKVKVSKMAVKDCKVDYVRVGINCSAELKEGEIKWEAYDEILDCMNHLRKARPDIKFFAIPRPLHVGATEEVPYICYPLWIAEFGEPNSKGKRKCTKFHPDKAADYLVRYLKFIRGKGFEITYMDTKNENDFLRPPELSKMVARIKEQLGDKTPIIIAPSSYDYQSGTGWLQEAIEKKETDFFQIAATHNTKEKGSLEEFVKLAQTINKPSWNTELHDFKGPDNVAALNTEILFKQVRAGISGISEWMSLGQGKKEHKMFRAVDGKLVAMRTYYIFKQLVNTSGGGNYLHTDIPEEITTSAAFIKENTLTIWALNADEETIANLSVQLEKYKIDKGDVEVMSWGPIDPREGSVKTLKVVQGADKFNCNIPPCTLHCYAFKIKE